jgi:hypothetical protein
MILNNYFQNPIFFNAKYKKFTFEQVPQLISSYKMALTQMVLWHERWLTTHTKWWWKDREIVQDIYLAE